jgi:hypothetical protein
MNFHRFDNSKVKKGAEHAAFADEDECCASGIAAKPDSDSVDDCCASGSCDDNDNDDDHDLDHNHDHDHDHDGCCDGGGHGDDDGGGVDEAASAAALAAESAAMAAEAVALAAAGKAACLAGDHLKASSKLFLNNMCCSSEVSVRVFYTCMHACKYTNTQAHAKTLIFHFAHFFTCTQVTLVQRALKQFVRDGRIIDKEKDILINVVVRTLRVAHCERELPLSGRCNHDRFCQLFITCLAFVTKHLLFISRRFLPYRSRVGERAEQRTPGRSRRRQWQRS